MRFFRYKKHTAQAMPSVFQIEDLNDDFLVGAILPFLCGDISLYAVASLSRRFYRLCQTPLLWQSPEAMTTSIGAAAESGNTRLVEEIIRARGPEVAREMDRGWLPLHDACRHHGDNQRLILTLMNAFPEGIMQKTPRGSLPLHLLIRHFGEQATDLIRIVLHAYPQAAQEHSEGWLPLHILVRAFGNNTEAIDFVLQAFPDAVKRRCNGWLPLHILCRYFGNSPASIELILHEYPESAFETSHGWHPMHLLTRNFSNARSINLVYTVYPEAIAIPEPSNSCLPLHLLMFARTPEEYPTIEAAQMLLERFPEAARIPCKSGMLPLNQAHNCVKDVELITQLVSLFAPFLQSEDECSASRPCGCLEASSYSHRNYNGRYFHTDNPSHTQNPIFSANVHVDDGVDWMQQRYQSMDLHVYASRVNTFANEPGTFVHPPLDYYEGDSMFPDVRWNFQNEAPQNEGFYLQLSNPYMHR